MTITKQKNGTYQVRVQIGYDRLTKKREYKKKTVKTRKEAQFLERQLLNQIDNGELVPSWRRKAVKLEHAKFDDVAWMWFDEYRQRDLAPATIKQTKKLIERHLLRPELFGGKYIERLTRSGMQKLANEFVPTLTNGKQIMGYAKQILNYAVVSDEIKLDINPMDNIRYPKNKKAPQRDTKYYDERQAKLFELGIKEYWEQKRPDLYTLFSLLLRTGARVGEITALTWDDIDLTNQIITLDKRLSSTNQKDLQVLPGLKNGDAMRVVDIDNHTVELLHWYKTRQASRHLEHGATFNKGTMLFSSVKPQLLGRNRLIRSTIYANELRRFVGWYNETHPQSLPWLNIHGLRHTHASLLMSHDVSLKKVADRLGHKDINITANIYADVTPTAKKDLAKTFENILAI